MLPDLDNLVADFGQRVRTARMDLGMSQEELAVASGLHRTHISSIERGQRNPSVVNVVRLARALQVTSGVLLPD